MPRSCRRDERAGGTEKNAYATRAEAEQAMAGDPYSNVYECPHGHGWHVGHKRGYRYGMGAGRKRKTTKRPASP